MTIDSKHYTVQNLSDLPPELSPENFALKTIISHTFFFSEATPLSNFHPSNFAIDGFTYKNGEMSIQATKARLFKDDYSLKRIMAAQSPGEAKALGAIISFRIHGQNLLWKHQ